jgi:mRNA interferase HigB
MNLDTPGATDTASIRCTGSDDSVLLGYSSSARTLARRLIRNRPDQCIHLFLICLSIFAIFVMHIISRRILRDFWATRPQSTSSLLHWHTTLLHAKAGSFAELKTVFNTVDWVEGYVVFHVGGNNYRIVADVVFRSQTVFIKHVFTHKEYDACKP